MWIWKKSLAEKNISIENILRRFWCSNLQLELLRSSWKVEEEGPFKEEMVEVGGGVELQCNLFQGSISNLGMRLKGMTFIWNGI